MRLVARSSLVAGEKGLFSSSGHELEGWGGADVVRCSRGVGRVVRKDI